MEEQKLQLGDVQETALIPLSNRALVIVEGLFMYFSKEDNQKILKNIV